MTRRRNLSALRLGRCLAFLAATAFLLPFTILVLVADQQFKLTYNSKRVFYQESDFARLSNGTAGQQRPNENPFNIFSRKQYPFDNATHEETTLLPRARMQVVHERMQERREHLEKECARTGLDGGGYKAYTWEYLINRQYHIIWCNIFKAASTSWMYNFNLMANYSAEFLGKTKEIPLQLARKKYARPSVEMVKRAQQDSITFLIVRHPFERLLSAYKDKICHAWPRSLHARLGQRIIRKYRKKGKPGDRLPTFTEFVSYLLDEVKARKTLDMHWTPYTAFCAPCRIHIDVVIKFETLEEDQKYLIQLAHLQEIIKPKKLNASKGDTTNEMEKYYSTLSRDQLKGLHNLYRYDIELFGYSIDRYYELVQKD